MSKGPASMRQGRNHKAITVQANASAISIPVSMGREYGPLTMPLT
ncbi:hypothetical protein Y695_02607 [Hydrogenophaga sp. T4]|nr:hypothetical protein Y695_02607 [Hydrogenophaga sp. T4]